MAWRFIVKPAQSLATLSPECAALASSLLTLDRMARLDVPERRQVCEPVSTSLLPPLFQESFPNLAGLTQQ